MTGPGTETRMLALFVTKDGCLFIDERSSGDAEVVLVSEAEESLYLDPQFHGRFSPRIFRLHPDSEGILFYREV